MSTDNPHDNCLTIGSIPPMVVLRPTVMGRIASNLLKHHSHFIVRGITSKGVFLELNDQWVIFLSDETHKGPLNINIPGQLNKIIPLINLKESGQIDGEQSLLFQRKMTIITRDAPIWGAALSGQPEFSTYQFDNENNFLHYVRNKLPKTNQLLESVSKIIAEPEKSICIQSEQESNAQLCKFVLAFQQKDFLIFEQVVKYFVGRGSGLTPSGDDLLMGLIFSFFHVQENLPFSFEKITDFVLEVTKKTTRISASLIACAAQGELDERLLLAYQSLITNREPSAEIVTGLLNWGSSSGLDALAGMLLGCHINSLKPK